MLEHCVRAPFYSTPGSSGVDLFAAISEEVLIASGSTLLVPTGIILELPPGIEAQIRGRSGLALKYGIVVLNGVGTVDSDYRGEIKVILLNQGQNAVQIQPGQMSWLRLFGPKTGTFKFSF